MAASIQTCLNTISKSACTLLANRRISSFLPPWDLLKQSRDPPLRAGLWALESLNFLKSAPSPVDQLHAVDHLSVLHRILQRRCSPDKASPCWHV